MSARFEWLAVDTEGNGETGLDIDLYRHSNDAKIDDFTEVGNGVYYVDHNISEKVYIKVGGTKVTATDGMMFPADDVALATDLASTASGKGASLVGVEDSGDLFTGTTVEAILSEIATYARLALTTNGNGAALIGVEDDDGYFTGDDVEAVLAEVGAIVALLTGLTSTAAELNKLDGASANVTATNLNLLTGAAETTLHTHNANALAGNSFEGNAQEDMDVYLRSQFTEQYGAGDAILDVAHADACGKAYVRKWDADDAATLYEIATSWLVGDGNFSGDPILGSIAFPGKITNAIRRLAQVAYNIALDSGFNKIVLYRGGLIAGASVGNSADDPATTVKWTDTDPGGVIKARVPFLQTTDMATLWVKLEAKNASAGSQSVTIYVDGLAVSVMSVSSTSYAPYSASIDLRALPVTVPTWRTLMIELSGDSGNALTVNEQIECWVEK